MNTLNPVRTDSAFQYFGTSADAKGAPHFTLFKSSHLYSIVSLS